MRIRSLARVVSMGLCLCAPAVGGAQVADIGADYAITANPNGPWTYGRKWTVDGTGLDVMSVRWGDSGWYLGNWGHGGPSIQGGPSLWAKDNSNGYPVVRWTSPAAGTYRVAGAFTGADGRGVDSRVYVVVDGTIQFSGHVSANGATVPFALDGVALTAGASVDFIVVWNGGVYSEYSWTALSGAIAGQAACLPAPSLVDFCGAIDATTIIGRRTCLRADWNNDEPLMRRAERDCDVERGTPDRCVPRPEGSSSPL